MRTRTVGLLKQKGGAGATTIAVHLAVAARDAGQRVCILDTDPQRSAVSWSTARGDSEPPVVPVSIEQLDEALTAATADGYDLVLIDTPPHSSAATAVVARISDLAILPTRPSALDLAAMPATLAIVQATHVPSVIVLNACPPRAPEVAEIRELLGQSGVPVWEGQIGERTAFRRAIAHGLAVTEPGADTDGKAANEMRELWSHVAILLSR
jgi:chromosome partitioning protein